MTRGFSLYLDALRFLAAMVVFASHLGYERFTKGGMEWIRDLNLGSDAVVVFFVLSGFVIAHTTFARDRGPAAYAQARAQGVELRCFATKISPDFIDLGPELAIMG